VVGTCEHENYFSHVVFHKTCVIYCAAEVQFASQKGPCPVEVLSDDVMVLVRCTENMVCLHGYHC